MTTTFSLTRTAAAKLKTVAAVVLVSWRSIALPTFSLSSLLASSIGFIGDAATAEQILEAPKEVENLPDDNTCLGPRQKCSGCADAGNICTYGSVDNSACDYTTCPTVFQELKSSETTCAQNENNECTKGNPGYDCTPEEEWPGVKDITRILECNFARNGMVPVSTCRWYSCEGQKRCDAELVAFGIISKLRSPTISPNS
jgi:hypothetical protein